MTNQIPVLLKDEATATQKHDQGIRNTDVIASEFIPISSASGNLLKVAGDGLAVLPADITANVFINHNGNVIDFALDSGTNSLVLTNPSGVSITVDLTPLN